MQSDKTGYRSRIEVAFSVVKRVFGEYVVAKFVNVAKEDGDEEIDLQATDSSRRWRMTGKTFSYDHIGMDSCNAILIQFFMLTNISSNTILAGCCKI